MEYSKEDLMEAKKQIWGVGYQAAVGQPVIQSRRPNSRLDKVRYMFQKIM